MPSPARSTAISNPGLWLAAVSAAVTAASWVAPGLRDYAMGGASLARGDWAHAALQLALYQFLHGGLWHWAANALFLAMMGPYVVARSGAVRFWALFAGNTLFVAGAIVLFSEKPVMGISGLCVALTAWYALDAGRDDPQQAKAGAVLVALNVLAGLQGGVSLTGHAAGAVFGALFWLGEKTLGTRK